MKLRLKPVGKAQLSFSQLTVLSLLGAVLFAVQVVLSFLPNIELVSLLIILYTRVYGAKAFYPVYLFVLMEGLYYGFNTWFINYLYVWAVLVFVTLLLRRHTSTALWTFVNAAFGLFFGAFCSIIYLFLGGVPAMLSYWISGIPFDVLHMVGNGLTAFVLLPPLYRLLARLNKQTLL